LFAWVEGPSDPTFFSTLLEHVKHSYVLPAILSMENEVKASMQTAGKMVRW